MLSAVLMVPFAGYLVRRSSVTISASLPPNRLHVAPLSNNPRQLLPIILISAYGRLSPDEMSKIIEETSRKCGILSSKGIVVHGDSLPFISGIPWWRFPVPTGLLCLVELDSFW